MSKINMTMSGGNSALDMQMSPKNNGSGTSTSNYPDLANKPLINNVELVGNKTAKELGLVDEATYKALEEIVAKKLNDILIGENSIVNENGVANIPHNAISDYFGTERTPSTYSIANGWTPLYISNGILNVREANDTYISNRTNESNRAVLTSNKVDSIVRTAMGDGKGAQWTNEEKANARSRLGCEWRYIGKVETTEDVSSISLNIDENGQPFNLRKVRIVFKNMPNSGDFGGWINVVVNDTCQIQNWFAKGVKTSEKYFASDSEFEVFGDTVRSNVYYRSMDVLNNPQHMIPGNNTYLPYNFEAPKIDDFINSIKLYGYQNSIGTGATLEVWGVDA